ncbi:MAG: hypothetical protein ACREQ9_18015, partial [Candidatus Binatia bacterium]
ESLLTTSERHRPLEQKTPEGRYHLDVAHGRNMQVHAFSTDDLPDLGRGSQAKQILDECRRVNDDA